MSESQHPLEVAGIVRKDPLLRRDEMHPTLDQESIDRIAGYGERRHVEAGTVLWEVGDHHTQFIVVLSGELSIEVDGCAETTVIGQHSTGKFSGEIDMFSNRRAVVRGRCTRAGEMLFFNRKAFRRVLASDATLSEVITRAFILRRTALVYHELGDLVLLGGKQEPKCVGLRAFLMRNGHPHRLIDTDSQPELAETLRKRFGLEPTDLPAVISRRDSVLKQPTIREVADLLGLSEPSGDRDVYDVAVIGLGPGGLAAAVNAAAEGLSVIALDSYTPGGQAGTSSKIENYPAFPTGISGQALGGRMMLQAQKFGAEIIAPRSVKAIRCDVAPYTLTLEDGTELNSRSVVIATGATWRRLGADQEARFENAGIYYGATAMEAALCEGEEVVVVGGGNSAGQAAVFLSQRAKHVHILVRGTGLAASMSDYLIQRIEASPRITLRCQTEINALHGETHLEEVTWKCKDSDSDERRPIRHVFVMIGAVPNTRWLEGCVMMDERGFIKTDVSLPTDYLVSHDWAAGRLPYTGETSRPGIFAVGDVRSGSVKRVASAVGEGAIAAQYLYKVTQG